MDMKSIVKKIETLPPLSSSAMIIQKLYAEGAENVDIIRLVRIIEMDSVISANILKMINAPEYNFSKKIASVSQAVTLFGTEIVYGLVMKYFFMKLLQADTSAYGVTSEKFNDICHLQSTLMIQWYSKIDLRHAQFLAPLTLMMETGKLVIAKVLSENRAADVFKNNTRDIANLEKYEFSVFGTTSYYVTALLFEHWNFEPLYVEMLKRLDFKHDDNDFEMNRYINSLRVIRTAVNVKDVLSEKSIKKAALIVEEMGLDSEHFIKVAKRVKNNYEKPKY
jgi:HD-like signal output (HDOD) protein